MRRAPALIFASLGVVSLVACLDLSGLVPAAPPCEGAGCEAGSPSPGPDQGDGGVTDGLVDGCTSGCVVTCNGITCNPHERCNGALSPPACDCAIGYSRDAGACTWTGGPLDPGFAGTPANAWNVVAGSGNLGGGDAGVTFVPNGDGGTDPGFVNFGNVCTPARVTQMVPMPSYAEAEPLALALVVAPNFPSATAIDLWMGGKRLSRTTTALLGFQSLRTCLGEGAFGASMELALGRPSCEAFKIDRAGFVPDPSCPAPGKVVSPDFQSAGWAVSGGGEITTTGLNGTSGRLVTTTVCSQPKLVGSFSIPSSMQRPALAIKSKGTQEQLATVAIEGRRFGVIVGTNAIEDVKVCLPDWPRGLVTSLELAIPPRGTDCSLDYTSEFLFDDMSVVEEPSCESPGYVFDPSFERAPTAKVRYFFSASKQVRFDGQFLKFSTPTLLRIEGERPDCSGASKQTKATVFVSVPPPPAPGAAGAPKVTFQYMAQIDFSSTGDFSVAGQPLASAPYPGTVATVCLPRSRAGTGFELDFAVNLGTCSSSGSLSLDDVSLSWEPTCP